MMDFYGTWLSIDFGFSSSIDGVQEILITAGGENVAPVLLEDNIKAELPCVSQAMVVGDRRKFLSVLLTLKVGETPNKTRKPKSTGLYPFWFSRRSTDGAGVVLLLRRRYLLDVGQTKSLSLR